MRDPDLVQRAERAANALEQAWMRWRVQHGLGSGPQPPVSSYVGYSLEEPWGQARVVLGVAAEEAERFAAVLEGHDCEGPIREGASAWPEPSRPTQVGTAAPAWTALNGSLAIPAQPSASRQPDRAPSVPAPYVPAQSGTGQSGTGQSGNGQARNGQARNGQSGDAPTADAAAAGAQPDADPAGAGPEGAGLAEAAGSLEPAALAEPARLPEPAGLPEPTGSSYPAPEFTVAADDLAAVQPSLPAVLGRAAAVADMPAELPPVAAAHLQELAALPPIPPAMSQAFAPPAPAADHAPNGSPAEPPAASQPGVVTVQPGSASPHDAPSELSQPGVPERQQDQTDRQQDRADQPQEHGDGAAASSHRSPDPATQGRLRPASKLNRQRRLTADHEAPSWQSAGSQGPQAATDTVV